MMNTIPEMLVTTHPLKDGKWSVRFHVGTCDSSEEADKLAEKIGPAIGEAIYKVLK